MKNDREIWVFLGEDPDVIFNTIKEAPLVEKEKVVMGFLEKAKKISKMMMAKNHPDVGGNQEKFIKIQEVIKLLEERTDNIIIKIKNKIIEKEYNMKKKKHVIINK